MECEPTVSNRCLLAAIIVDVVDEDPGPDCVAWAAAHRGCFDSGPPG
jgi:hypothetical protein